MSLYFLEMVEPELLHTYSKLFKFDVVLLIVRLAVLTAVTLTVPVVLFPVSKTALRSHSTSYYDRYIYIHINLFYLQNHCIYDVHAVCSLSLSCSLYQIRTSVNQLLGASKSFSWIRHTIITVTLLVACNCLVIFVPTIRDIFGFIGKSTFNRVANPGILEEFYSKEGEKVSIKCVICAF